MSPTYDVVVAGSGNAALCAALAAREAGASVLIVEKAPESQRGGNSFFTAGGFRFAHQGLEDLRRDILPDISEEEARAIVVPPYTENQFYDDLMRVTEGRADFDMAQHLVQRSRPTVAWMRSQGLRLILMFARQSYQVEGKHQFWGGLNVEAVGGGPGLVEMQLDRARKVGIEVRYGHGARRLLTDDQGGITGLVVRAPEGLVEIPTRAVVLACGGFEANPEMRTRYLGPNWDLARVRGTRHNTGEGIRMALDIGAQAYGHWSSCHAVQWDLNAPPFGDRKVGDMFQKHSYPLGIIVNVHGQRFVDEGADFRNFTYVKYGQAVIRQPPGSSRSTPRVSSAPSANSMPPCRTSLSIPPSSMGGGRGASRPPRRTGPRPSTRRPMWASASRAGSPSRSAVSGWICARRCRTSRISPFAASMPRASWWAGSSTTTIRAAPGSWPAPSSAGSPANQRHGISAPRGAEARRWRS